MKEENQDGVINLPNGKSIVINGGAPLPGCPESPEQAHAWSDAANGENEEWTHPKWSWDCGYKLDYDGPLVSISSRFYPPKTHYGATWDGTVTVRVLGEDVTEKSFDCPSLDALRADVEAYVKSILAPLAKSVRSAAKRRGEPREPQHKSPVTNKLPPVQQGGDNAR